MAVGKVVFARQLQDDSKQHQQLVHDAVMDVAGKVLYLCPVSVDDFGLSPLEGWDELGDVEDLRVVEDAGLDFLLHESAKHLMSPTCLPYIYMKVSYPQAERLIPVVATILQVGPVQELFFGGKVKDCLANGKLPVDLFLAEAKIDDVEEPDRLQGFEELSGKALFPTRLIELG